MNVKRRNLAKDRKQKKWKRVLEKDRGTYMKTVFFGDKKLSEIRFNGRTEKYCK